jgi:hypothetical protein
MRLVLVHGINQQRKDPDALRQEWIEDLERGLGRPGVLADVPVSMPFYGDTLFQSANSPSAGAITQGTNPDDDRSLAQFLAEGLDEQAAAMGIRRSEITAEQERASSDSSAGIAVDQGFPMSRRINALVSLIERLSPFRGDLVVRLLDQAYTYLKKPQASLAVDALVRPALEAGPMVLVTHSLGTVVSFKLLRLLAASGNPAQVPLYVTLGSPLALSTVQRALGPSFATPAGINRWINARDPDDVISLNRGLGAPLFSTSIENIVDFENPGADAHAIPGYLSHPPVAQAIALALGV